MTTPETFSDPLVKPVKFTQRVPSTVFAFGESSFPVSFSFNERPRPAVFSKVATTQLGVVFTDKEILGSTVMQFASGSSQIIELHANERDILTTDFFIKIHATDGSIVPFLGYDVAEIRQPVFDIDISHIFKNGDSTVLFDGVNYGGNLYYPSVFMRLTVLPTLIDNEWPASTITTEAGSSTSVTIAPAGAFGVVDVKIDVDIDWYDDVDRLYKTSVVPSDVTIPQFGVRFFVSSPGKFAKKITLAERACTVGALYPTSVLNSLGGEGVQFVYWGKGEDGTGLFWGREESIEVSSNGLAIQDSAETATYVLANQLDDYDSSSSSGSSASSLNSASSTSSLLNTSSLSTPSTTSESSSSSLSTSSRSTNSFSSSSSSSISSASSITSESSSSSTEILILTTSSSVLEDSGRSSSSSIMASILAKYNFGIAPDVDREIADDSGNGNTLTTGAVGGGLGPPAWGATYGRAGGGGLRFQADVSNSDYLIMARQPWTNTRGTISFWAKPFELGNGEMVAFCLSNGNVTSKTELAVAIDVSAGKEQVLAWVIIDGVVQWKFYSDVSSLSTNSWHNVVLVQNGSSPLLYIDGVSANITFDIDLSEGAWVSDLTEATSPASMMVVGAAPRYYAPQMALGFYGLLDEITLWDESLSASYVAAIYTSTEA